MADWLLVEIAAALLSAVLWGEPAPADSEPKCGGAAVEAVQCEGEGGER